MTRHSRTQNEMAKKQNKEQIVAEPNIDVFRQTLKITMMSIFREVDQNGKYQTKIATLESFKTI